MKYGELTLGQIEALVNKVGGMDGVQDILSGLSVVVKKSVAVGSSLKNMIALGHYDWVNSDITEKRFPMAKDFVPGAEPEVFHFHSLISSDKAIAIMGADGYRPATIFDLLDYGAKKPEEQRKYPIVALGSVADIGGCSVAYLDVDGDSKRYLDLDRFFCAWDASYRFLAVRK